MASQSRFRNNALALLTAIGISWTSIASAANVVVTIAGTRGAYTVQFFRNGAVYRTCHVTNQLGTVNFMLQGMPDYSSCYAKATFDLFPTPSNTWPPKYGVTGTVHLGCLNFDSGTPIPWSGACPPLCWNCGGHYVVGACN
jgi:hypothetical protein